MGGVSDRVVFQVSENGEMEVGIPWGFPKEIHDPNGFIESPFGAERR
jgi:hypothetical protein